MLLKTQYALHKLYNAYTRVGLIIVNLESKLEIWPNVGGGCCSVFACML